MGIIWSFGLLLFLFADWLHIPYYVGPVSTWVVWLILFSLPVPLLYWRSRWWLFKEIVSGCGQWVAFGVTLKIHKKSNFDRNQLKLSTQHKYMYMYQKKLLKWRILSFSFFMKFGQTPCTIVQGL